MNKLPLSPEAEALISALADAYTVADLAQVLGRAEQIAEAEAGVEAVERWHIYQSLEEFGMKGETSNGREQGIRSDRR